VLKTTTDKPTRPTKTEGIVKTTFKEDYKWSINESDTNLSQTRGKATS
jgi:hypothetical protein